MAESSASPRIMATVPAELAEQAIAVAKRDWPGIGRSGVVRLALARLAGLPDSAALMATGRPRIKRLTSDD